MTLVRWKICGLRGGFSKLIDCRNSSLVRSPSMHSVSLCAVQPFKLPFPYVAVNVFPFTRNRNKMEQTRTHSNTQKTNEKQEQGQEKEDDQGTRWVKEATGQATGTD